MFGTFLRTALRSLAFKLGLALALAVLVTVACVSGQAYFQARRNAVQQELGQLLTLAGGLANRVDRSLATGKDLAGHLACTRDAQEFLAPGIRGPEARTGCRQWLDRQVRLSPGLGALFLVDTGGTCLASSEPSFLGHNFSFRPYFQEAMAGRPADSDWMLGSVSGLPRIFSAAPVRRERRVIGVLVAEYQVDEVEQAIRAAGVNGRTAMVLNAQGIAIVHSDPALQYHALLPLEPPARAELRRSRQFHGLDPPEDPVSPEFAAAFRRVRDTGRPQTVAYRIGASAKWAVLSPLAERPWAAALSIPETALMQPIRKAMARTLLAGLASALGGFLVALALGRALVAPIHLLSEAMARFGAGDSAARAPVLSQDERGRLAGEFNAMADTLQAHRERLEELVKARTRELTRSESQYRSLARAVPVGIFRLDADGNQLYANDRWRRITGLEGVAGGPAGFEACIHPDDRARARASFLPVFRTHCPAEAGFRLVRPDGQVLWVMATVAPEVDEALQVVGYIGTLVDRTERQRAGEERAQLQAKLVEAQKMESLGSLAGGIAHDMNNVLAAILGLASASMGALPEGSRGRAAFATIVKAADRGGSVVQGLLNLARQSPAELRRLDLNGLLQEQARLLEHTTFSKVRLELELAAGLRPILGDASALSHCFMNLCVNAVDAMAETGTLTLRTRDAEPDEVEVQVQDTGCGMDQEVLDKALNPFYTTKPQGKGTGLGLSMVYSTVKAHGGRLELRSKPGRGTTVSLRFPAAPGGADPAEAAAASPVNPEAALAILLVDDDDLVLSATQALLEVLGHHPEAVDSGEAALARVGAGFRPDAIILDLNMPGLGGAATLPALRALLPTVPVLLATGRADQVALDLVAAHPQVSLLSKPFSLETLRDHLRLR